MTRACNTSFAQIGADHGRIDALIHCASIFSSFTMKPCREIESADWDQVIDVNLKGTFNTCKAALPWLKRSGVGRIINFSSAVVPMGRPNYLHYVSSKAGVQGLTRAMAREVGDFDITVNAILPGATVTEVPRETVSRTNEGHDSGPLHKTPQEVSDLTGLVGFLCSASGFHNRSIICCRWRSGGYLITKDPWDRFSIGLMHNKRTSYIF